MLEGLVARDPRAHVHRGDAVRILTNDVLPRCLYRDYVRALCFLDPYGLQVPWTLVNEIGHMGSVEVFYNFMIVGANRNVLWTDPSRVPPTRLAIMDRVWGDRTWKDVAYRRRMDLFGDTRPEKVPNEELAEAFRTRLRDGAGFKYVPEPIAMKNSRNATVYFLFFASPNVTANKIVTDIFNKYR